MKRFFTLLALTVLLLPNAYADKAEITHVWSGGDMVLNSCDEMGCTFACDSAFMASFYAHKDMSLNLQLIIDDTDTIALRSWMLRPDTPGTVMWSSGCFCIPEGSEFSLVWTMESTKNGRIIDAQEAFAGSCN
jgi:hypothetical protein